MDISGVSSCAATESDTDATAVGAAVLGVASVPGVIDASLAIRALQAGDASTKDGFDANAAAISAAVLGVAVVVWRIDADVILVLALDVGEATAELIGRLWRARGRLGHQSGRGSGGHAVTLTVFAAIAAGVDFLADLAGRARSNLKAARAPLGSSQASGSKKGENSERKIITHS